CGALEHGIEEPVLVAEVVVDLRLVRVGGGRDALDAGAGDAVRREFLARGLQEPPPGRGGIPLRRLRHADKTIQLTGQLTPLACGCTVAVVFLTIRSVSKRGGSTYVYCRAPRPAAHGRWNRPGDPGRTTRRKRRTGGDAAPGPADARGAPG